MHPLIHEALQITKELGPITFVGAVAVLLHTKNTRESRDLDFAIAKQMTQEELLNKGYKIVTENRKEKTYTPRGFKVDIYYDRPLNGIPIKTIIDTSQDFTVDNKGNIVNAIGLEALVLAKFRANRPEQDYPDLKTLAIERRTDIRWDLLESLSGDEYEIASIRKTLDTLSN